MMRVSVRVTAAAAIAVLLAAGCAHRNENVNRGELVVSERVKRYFAENPEVDTLETNGGSGGDQSIRCERQRRVGTHRVVRVCRTRAEWRQLREDTERLWREDHMLRIPCPDCSEGRPSGPGAG